VAGAARGPKAMRGDLVRGRGQLIMKVTKFQRERKRRLSSEVRQHLAKLDLPTSSFAYGGGEIVEKDG